MRSATLKCAMYDILEFGQIRNIKTNHSDKTFVKFLRYNSWDTNRMQNNQNDLIQVGTCT